MFRTYPVELFSERLTETKKRKYHVNMVQLEPGYTDTKLCASAKLERKVQSGCSQARKCQCSI